MIHSDLCSDTSLCLAPVDRGLILHELHYWDILKLNWCVCSVFVTVRVLVCLCGGDRLVGYCCVLGWMNDACLKWLEA